MYAALVLLLSVVFTTVFSYVVRREPGVRLDWWLLGVVAMAAGFVMRILLTERQPRPIANRKPTESVPATLPVRTRM